VADEELNGLPSLFLLSFSSFSGQNGFGGQPPSTSECSESRHNTLAFWAVPMQRLLVKCLKQQITLLTTDTHVWKWT